MENGNINPWGDLWIHPKKTIRHLIDTSPKKIIIWLVIISGVLSAISTIGMIWLRYPDRESAHHPLFILATLVAGAILGIIYLYFWGWLFSLTGNWIEGKGNFTQVKCAVGWSHWPFIIVNILNIISMLVVQTFWLQVTFSILTLIAAIWWIVIFFNVLGEAHRFSAWKGVLAFLIAQVLVFVAVMIISLIVPLLFPIFQS